MNENEPTISEEMVRSVAATLRQAGIAFSEEESISKAREILSKNPQGTNNLEEDSDQIVAAKPKTSLDG